MVRRRHVAQPRRGWLGILLIFSILLVSAEGVRLETGTFLMDEDVEWPWLPQLDLPLPPDFMSGQRILSTPEQWMVLAHVGAPFRVVTDTKMDLMRLLEVVKFMLPADAGVCPRYSTTRRIVHYWFHPEQLSLLFGEERWSALQRLQRPAAWSLVLKDDAGPAVRAAERFIAKLQALDPPGQITLISRRQSSSLRTTRVSLADFKVLSRLTRMTNTIEYRLTHLTVDAEAPLHRMQIQRLLRAKLRYHEHIKAFDEAVAEAQRDLHVSLQELLKSEQAAYADHVHFKRSYQRFLVERQSRLRAEKGVKDAADGSDGESSMGRDAGSRRTAATSIHRAAGTSLPSPLDGSRDVSCRKVLAAWSTLRAAGVCHEAEIRVAQLRRLHSRHRCKEPLPELLVASSTVRGEAGLSPAAAHVWRDGVAEMKAQRRKSGASPTPAQVFAILYGVWEEAKAATQAAGHAREATSAAGVVTTAVAVNEAFNASAFAAFVEHLVQSGDALSAAPNSRLPRWIRAELHYTLALLQLIRPKTRPSEKHPATVSSSVRAVVHLHESLSAGSHHAAGALATLREHGIFARQQSKAAMMLLLQSMEQAPTHLWRELLLRRSPCRSHEAARAASARADPSRLLRFEQFYAVDHTFSEVDDPFMTRQSIATLIAVTSENIHTGDEEPEMEDVYREAEVGRGDDEYEGRLTARLNRRLLKASMLFSGFKGVQRDAREAQCELLVILRRLGYVCDLDLRRFYTSGVPSHVPDSPPASSAAPMTIIGVPLPDSCAEHETELVDVMSNSRHTLLSCPNGVPFPPRRSRRQLDVPNSEALFELLLQTLLALSYVQLIHRHRYDMSHLYASLALEMSLRVPRATVERCAQAANMSAFVEAHHHPGDSNGSWARSFLEAVNRVADSDSEVAWAAEVLLDQLQSIKNAPSQARGDGAALGHRVQRVLRRFASVADSPFVSTESLLLIGTSRWAARGPLSGAAAEVAAFEKDLAEWTMEPFSLFHRLLQKRPRSSSAAATQQTPHPSHSGAAPGSSMGVSLSTTVMDVHALFLVCLAAMKRWRSDFPLVHTLDATTYSARRTDPFVLSSFLLRARDTATGAPLISIEKLRDVAYAASPHFLGESPQLLPLVDDTVDSYAARLLRFAARHIHALEPCVELLRSGGYGVRRTDAGGAASAGMRMSGHWGSSLDDGPPRKSRLQTLRKVKQHTMENADLQPLLYAADVHDYMNKSRWTSVATVLSAVYKTVLYPFTTTAAEALIADMEAQMQLVTPEEHGAELSSRRKAGTEESPSQETAKGTARSAGTGVSAFVDAFAKDAALREFFIAGQLLTVALESGMPEGFSLVLLEAADRGNRYLRPIAEHLAESVFGRMAPSVWTEHHLTAQWQREEEELVGEGPLFVLDTRTPFRYASVEARQELFARVSRWNAAKAQQGDIGEVYGARERQRTRVSQALDQLLWCAGFLTRRVYRDTHRVYPYAYEGSVFPASDLECVADMNRLLRSQRPAAETAASVVTEREPAWTLAEWRHAQKNGTALLRDLSERLGYVYDTVEGAPARRFPLSAADFSRNVTVEEHALLLAERNQDYPSRFARVSTQLVEPWNRLSKDYSEQVVAYGEGFYYNQRLHRISGYRWGAILHIWWLRVRNMWPW
ncbi:conserved hypothetical protein [Leishmania infantum JPCM5]|uniref:Uncharacterized protein n=4 Tax=Leishmania donovani species complex TaxID=38574 RepID=A4ICN3_LEIIN|nr:conserved hypothetical protein [Leishmania infantum JPCM5]CAC9549265.1 hypothetical_protein_-_conserved [Leishmania infantum]CAM72611.1 conserved hypothetical protein [Leishmania infantum JPCM5]SUZ46479.1 hypothetical_protein_-_conserved [Leishmania infantum]VDZ49293.1 hypothetical_protein_conserved [Leishmania donovani]|eukprot:XP_001469502.1 conserved hypothetical protein [Leishmania infantum JPCM5]